MVPTFDPAGTFVQLKHFHEQLAALREELIVYADSIGEGDFSEAAVRATTLTGLSTQISGMVTAADTILSAIGKLENRIIANENNGIYWGSHANPNGNVTATAPAIYYPTDGSSFWSKTGVGSSNTGWVAAVGGPATG